MIGFAYYNMSGISTDHLAWAKSVDEIEELTGLDFFVELPDSLENSLESSYDESVWSGDQSHLTDSSISSNSKESNKKSKPQSIQCKGIAKSTLVRCQNRTLNTNGYCHHHQNQTTEKNTRSKSNSSGQCRATTKAGSRCKRSASSGGYCWQHQ